MGKNRTFRKKLEKDALTERFDPGWLSDVHAFCHCLTRVTELFKRIKQRIHIAHFEKTSIGLAGSEVEVERTAHDLGVHINDEHPLNDIGVTQWAKIHDLKANARN